MNREDATIKRIFINQIDQSDCGIACLMTLIKYHGGVSHHREVMRQLSGTTREGTTLLGLYQAATKVGLQPNGVETDIDHLKKINNPSILHIVSKANMLHYVVFFGFRNGKYLIGDPDPIVGIRYWSQEEIEIGWTGKMLIVEPGVQFVRNKQTQNLKWNWIKELLNDDKSIFITATITGIIISILTLSTAIFSQRMVDSILPSQSTTKLWTGIMLLSIMLFARGGLNYLRGLFLLKQSIDFNNRLINKFYPLLLSLPIPFFESRKTGELVSRMNDTRKIESAVSYTAGSAIVDLIILVSSIVMLYFYSHWIGSLAIIGFTSYIIVV